MKKGCLDYEEIYSNYYIIDSLYHNGDRWELFENNVMGDAVSAIAVNTTKRYYVYTLESLYYTAKNIYNEYEPMLLDEKEEDVISIF